MLYYEDIIFNKKVFVMQGVKFKKFICLITIIFCYLFTFNVSCLNSKVLAQNNKTAEISFNSESSAFVQGENLALNFKLKPNFNGNIQAFIINLYFNSSDLSFKGIGKFASIDSSDLSYFSSGDKIRILYVASNNGFSVKQNEDNAILGFNFKINSDAQNQSFIKATVEELIDDHHDNINLANSESDFNFSISAYQQIDKRLKALASNVGKLDPEFDPDITQYALEVPESTKQVLLSATPMDNRASVKVNRKNLFKAGSQTPIYVTVKTASGDTMQYTVTVNRLDSDDISNSNNKNKDSKGANGSKTSGSKNNKNGSGSSLFDNTNGQNNNFFVKQSKFLPIMVIILSLLLAFIGYLFILENKKKDILRRKGKDNGRKK